MVRCILLPQLVATAFGALKGLVWLNLGSVGTFQEMRQIFHKCPDLWWKNCVSQKGADRCTLQTFAATRGLPQRCHITNQFVFSTAKQLSGTSATHNMVQWIYGASSHYARWSAGEARHHGRLGGPAAEQPSMVGAALSCAQLTHAVPYCQIQMVFYCRIQMASIFAPYSSDDQPCH